MPLVMDVRPRSTVVLIEPVNEWEQGERELNGETEENYNIGAYFL